MSATGLETFDTTLQQTNLWLKDILEELRWEDRRLAYHGLRGTLHALRDHLTVDECAHFAAQLPLLIRGIYYEGWDPSRVPLRERHREEFLARIDAEFQRGPRINPLRVAQAVLSVTARHISAGEAKQVHDRLPREIRELWPVRPAS